MELTSYGFTQYETAEDKKNELELGGKFTKYLEPDIRLVNQGKLSTYDFWGYRHVFETTLTYQEGRPIPHTKDLGESLVLFLEVKKKKGFFTASEIIPTTKYSFAQKVKEKGMKAQCLFLVERDDCARLFDVMGLRGREIEIKRRAGPINREARRGL